MTPLYNWQDEDDFDDAPAWLSATVTVTVVAIAIIWFGLLILIASQPK